jgi:outer membrane protein assembly factor BamB
VWQQRLPTGGSCYASPVAAGAAIFVATTAGEVFTLAAAGSFALRGKVELGERVMASPAISDGVTYVRSDSHLHALAPPSEP